MSAPKTILLSIQNILANKFKEPVVVARNTE